MIIMLAVDPEAIILGGSVSRDFPYFERAMRERMRIFPYRKILERIIIEVSAEPRLLSWALPPYTWTPGSPEGDFPCGRLVPLFSSPGASRCLNTREALSYGI